MKFLSKQFRPRPRPAWTSTVGLSSQSSSSSDKSDTTGDGNDTKPSEKAEEDCPACVEYTAGPCGKEFQAWLDCSNRHEEDYEEKCKSQFNAFHNCVQWEWKYGTTLDDDPPDDDAL